MIEVHQRLWCLEERDRDAVGNTMPYDNYLKLEGAHLSPESIQHTRARPDNLIRELYRLYTVVACREEMRSRLSRRAMVIASFLLVFVIASVATLKVLDSALIPLSIRPS